MVDQGIQDFLLAKRKAADRHGVKDRAALPANSEIEAALIARQRLFGGDEHAESLQTLRQTALDAMRLLDKFQPRLVGAVLAGTATSHSDIQLHVFTDTPELLTLHLIDRRYDHEVFERKLRMPPDRQITVPSVRFEMQSTMIEAFVFPEDGIRQAPASPVDSKPMRRAGPEEVQTLLSESGNSFT